MNYRVDNPTANIIVNSNYYNYLGYIYINYLYIRAEALPWQLHDRVQEAVSSRSQSTLNPQRCRDDRCLVIFGPECEDRPGDGVLPTPAYWQRDGARLSVFLYEIHYMKLLAAKFLLHIDVEVQCFGNCFELAMTDFHKFQRWLFSRVRPKYIIR